MKYLKLILLLVFFGCGKYSFAQMNPAFVERVDFSIPKNIYFTGEKIWLSIQVEANSEPSPSKIVYGELWNRYGESVALAKVPMENGKAFNFLLIPEDLPSDHYLLRVFTRVSPRQDLEIGLVQEFVTVFNPRIPPEVLSESSSISAQNAVSPVISLSNASVPVGEKVTIGYTGRDGVLELSVAVPNPFLTNQGKIPSQELYESLGQIPSVPEFFGHIIEAKIEGESRDSIGSGLFYLSLHGEKSALFTDLPDEDGQLYFDAGGLRHWDFVIAQGRENQGMNDFELVTPSPKTKFKLGFEFPKLQISPKDEPFLSELLKGSQIEGYFVQEFRYEPIPVVTGFVQDRTFLLDDYTRFEDLETHIKEYVPEVMVRSRDGSKELRVLNEIQGRSFTKNPLLLVDAMPVFDSDFLLKFNPAQIQKMEILTRPFFLNEEKYSGVISFSSFQNDFGGYPLPANAVYVPYPGILPPVTEYETLFSPAIQDSGSMDWRTVLYWSPASEEVSGKSWSVTAPLLKGTFQVVIKTMDSNGKIKFEYSQFDVKDQ